MMAHTHTHTFKIYSSMHSWFVNLSCMLCALCRDVPNIYPDQSQCSANTKSWSSIYIFISLLSSCTVYTQSNQSTVCLVNGSALRQQQPDPQYSHAGVFTHLAHETSLRTVLDWHLPHSIDESFCTSRRDNLHFGVRGRKQTSHHSLTQPEPK